MAKDFNISVDVSDAAGLGETAWIAFTVHIPDDVRSDGNQIICFAKPGGGYSKEYYSLELPGPGTGVGSQANWHVDRGWIFVSVDSLGIGESSRHDAMTLETATASAAHVAAEAEIVDRLKRGTLDAAIPPIGQLIVLGMGQSLGGCLLIDQQGTYDCYDGVAVLAYSPVHQNASGPPGSETYVSPYLGTEEPRSEAESIRFEAKGSAFALPGPISDAAVAWSFFYFEETDWDLIVAEVDDFPFRHGVLAPWHTEALPFLIAKDAMTPGRLSPKAAAIRSPVLAIMGERDNVVDPQGEPRAFPLSTAIDIFICPRMGHMHNFASTREIFWRRIHSWGEWVRDCKRAGGYYEKAAPPQRANAEAI